MSERLASGPQLWRLNQAGRLRVISPVGESNEPITAAVASPLVAELAVGEVNESAE